MGKQLKIKRKKNKKVKIIVLISVLILVLAGVGIYFGFRTVNINYQGNKHYDKEQLNAYIFDGKTPNTLIYMLFGNKNKSIPFIQKYDVEAKWPDTLNISIYEKAIIGYINYMGCNMYFDKDGMVVESSSEEYEGVPQIDGLSFKSIVLGDKLEVGNDEIFDQILEMTQAFNKYELGVQKVYFSSDYNVELNIGDVRVILGDCRECTDKLFALKQMADKFTGLKGTLHMEDYNGDTTSVIFKKEN